MKQLINETGKILKYFYENEIGVSFNEFEEDCPIRQHIWWRHLTTNGKEYKNVYQRTSNNITKLRKDAIDYIKTK